MNEKDLLKKLDALRDKYTHKQDKDNIVALSKKVKKDLLILGIEKKKPILELVEFLNNEIDDITRLLSWDVKLSKMKEERDVLFAKRECYMNLLSFFTDAKNSLKVIKNHVEQETNEHF